MCLCLTLTLVFFPVISGEKTLFPADLLHTMILPYAHGQSTRVYNHFLNDVVVQYLPYKRLTQTALQAGRGAYWNPLILGGFPQYALTMAGNYDVTNILYLSGVPTERAYLLQILASLLIAGLAMFTLLRYYRLLWEAALLGAISYMLNSMFITTAFFPWILGPFCWMPLVVLFLDRSLKEGGGRNIAACGLFLGIAMMASSIQTMSFLMFITVVYTGLWWGLSENPRRPAWRVARPFLMVHILGAGVAAAMLIPTLELFYYDALKNGQWAQVGQGPIPFTQRLWGVVGLLSFVFPGLAGNVRAFDLTKLASSTMMFYNGFIGFLPLVFGVFSIKSARQDRRVLVFWGLALLGIIIPLMTPLLKYVYHRFFIVYIFAMSVLSAFGLSFYLGQEDRRVIRPLIKKFFIVFLFMVITLGIVNVMLLCRYDQLYGRAMDYVKAHIRMANLLAGNQSWYLARVGKLLNHFRFSSPQMFVPVLAMLSGLALLWTYGRGRLRKPVFIAGLFLLNVLQLGFFAREWLPMTDSKAYPLYPPTASANFLKKDQDLYRVLIYNINTKHKPVYSPNILSMYGIETINGYESVEPRTVRSLLRGVDPGALGLCNVKYVLTHADTFLDETHFHPVWEGDEGIKIYRNDLFAPRAFLRYDYEVVPEGEFLSGFHEGRVDPGQKVFLSQAPREPFEPEKAGGSPGPATVVPERYVPEEIVYRINSPQAGYLVVSNTWYPGWICYVDGLKQNLLKANGCMWSVSVPAGKHLVRFVFRPRVFSFGAGISMVFLIFIFMVMGKKRYA